MQKDTTSLRSSPSNVVTDTFLLSNGPSDAKIVSDQSLSSSRSLGGSRDRCGNVDRGPSSAPRGPSSALVHLRYVELGDLGLLGAGLEEIGLDGAGLEVGLRSLPKLLPWMLVRVSKVAACD